MGEFRNMHSLAPLGSLQPRLFLGDYHSRFKSILLFPLSLRQHHWHRRSIVVIPHGPFLGSCRPQCHRFWYPLEPRTFHNQRTRFNHDHGYGRMVICICGKCGSLTQLQLLIFRQTDIVAVQRVFYGQTFNFSCERLLRIICFRSYIRLDQWMLVMSTQLIGFSLGGVMRRFLVLPPSMSRFCLVYIFLEVYC